MALFKLGDRVAHHQDPDEGGTIVSIVEDIPVGALYEIDWDQPAGEFVEEAVLVRLRTQRQQ